MAISRNGLKTYFENGKKPTAAQFAALIDSFFHLDDNLGGTNAPFATVPQATAGFDDTTYMSPFLVYEAMKVLVRLTNIPALSTEVDNKISSAINDLLTLNDADTVINTVKEVIDAFNGLNEGDTLVALLQGKADASHTHTPAQVGLGNLPNAKSNSTSLNDANTLATSKAVYDLGLSKEDVFLKKTAFNKNFGELDGEVLNASEVCWRGRVEISNSNVSVFGLGDLSPTAVISQSNKTITINHNLNTPAIPNATQHYSMIVYGEMKDQSTLNNVLEVFVLESTPSNTTLSYLVKNRLTGAVQSGIGNGLSLKIVMVKLDLEGASVNPN